MHHADGFNPYHHSSFVYVLQVKIGPHYCYVGSYRTQAQVAMLNNHLGMTWSPIKSPHHSRRIETTLSRGSNCSVYFPFAALIASSNFGPERSTHSCTFACFSCPSGSISATSLVAAACAGLRFGQTTQGYNVRSSARRRIKNLH